MANNNMATKEAGKALTDALATNSTLKELDVSSNVDGEVGSYTKTNGPAFAQELANGVRANGALTSLNLASNWLKAEGAKQVAAALSECK